MQEQEFERLGSAQTIKTDVRLVAATNRNLVQMVQGQTFRDDLYYRLNVFPITVPPLRDRAEDIPLLVRHLVNKFSRRMNRAIESIPAQAMEALTHHHWPGNVRGLQNVIERAVVLSTNGMLRAPLPELKSTPRESSAAPSGSRMLEEAERDHILHALRETDWVLGGPEGAAERLGLKRSTCAPAWRSSGSPAANSDEVSPQWRNSAAILRPDPQITAGVVRNRGPSATRIGHPIAMRLGRKTPRMNRLAEVWCSRTRSWHARCPNFIETTTNLKHDGGKHSEHLE